MSMEKDNVYSYFGASKVFFEKSCSISRPLCKFFDTISNDDNIMQTVDKYLPDNKGDVKTTLMILINADLVNCFEQLGHDSTSLFSKEGLVLSIAEIYILFNHFCTYQDFSLQEYIDTVEKIAGFNDNYFKNNNKLREYPQNHFFLDDIFKKSKNYDYSIQYFSCLYRFFSVIAKADDCVTLEESEWLKKLMSNSHPRDYYDTEEYSIKGNVIEWKVIDVKKERKERINFKEFAEPNKQNLNNQEQVLSNKKDPFVELQSMIGLSEVKTDISTLAQFVKVQKEREKIGMKSVGLSYHCVFTGNPGTGKTTVARIVAEIYKELGVIKKGHLVETDRSGLVAEYVGQTAVKTNKIIDSALDGVLFIDEAYSLVQGTGNDFGQEAISTLLKRMEDDRDRLIVIIAGYSNEIIKFVDSNPGLQSRFNRYIHFPDYSADELMQIFLLNVKKNQYALDAKGQERLYKIMKYEIEHKAKNFGNGRFVRNLFEKTIQNQAIRLAGKPKITKEELLLLNADDLPSSALLVNTQEQNRGFEILEGGHKPLSTEVSSTTILRRKPTLDLNMILKIDAKVILTSDGKTNVVIDEKGEIITAKYIGDNIFECRGEQGRSSYFAKKYLNMYAGKNMQTVNGNEYWTFNGKKLTLLRKN